MRFRISRQVRWLGLAMAVLAAMATESPTATAGPLLDAAGDLRAPFVAAHPTALGDVDVLSAEVIFNPTASTFTFRAIMAANIGSTPGVLYVWGLDRGLANRNFAAIGLPGVAFDAVVIQTVGGTTVNDLAPGAVNPVFTGTVAFGGAWIESVVPLSALPSLGRSATSYTWNLWPRIGTANANTDISDFAPDTAMTAVTVAPEPGTGLIAVAGVALSLVVVELKRRKAREALPAVD
jgi:hypothetical protein